VNHHCILSHGAAGDGTTNDAPAIQRAIDACHAAGGGTVVVPAGKTYLTGAITLKSHVHLHVEGGARLLASEHEADYPHRILLQAHHAENISLTGTGTIDGRARLFMTEELPHIFRGTDWRPRLVQFIGCSNVTVRDLTLQDAAHWGLHLTGCTDVLIHGIRILNDLKVPNCDGIAPDHCRNVRISDCYIEAGDDCIVLKNTREHAQYGPTENITVTGCVLKSTSAALKIGTESVDDFRDILFSHCIVRGSSRGLAIQLRDEGNVENVLFSDMIVETRHFHEDWWGAAEPIYVTALPRTATTTVGQIRHVRFRNLLCRGENGAYLRGCADSQPTDVLLENVRLEVRKWTKWPGDRHDRRPGLLGVIPHRTAGLYCQHARDVTLRHVEVVHPHGPALEVHRVPGLKIENFTGAPQVIDDQLED
jgi:hypothetical protein